MVFVYFYDIILKYEDYSEKFLKEIFNYINFMETITGLFLIIWIIISFIIKVIVYLVYFVPFIGFRILHYLSLWPDLWPLSGVCF